MFASELTEQPIIPKKAQNFNYSELKIDIRRVVEQRTSEIKTILRRNTLDILEIGQKLIEVKEKLGHGHFLDWIEAEFKLDERTARRYMSAAEIFGLKSDIVSDLDITPTALYVLAAPSTPDSARIEALSRAKAGEPITPAIAKTIVKEHKPTATTKPNKAAKRVTVDTLAQTVERSSSAETSVDIKPLKSKHTQLGHKLADKPVVVLGVEPTRYATASPTVEEVENNPNRAYQDEQKLSGKEASPEVVTLEALDDVRDKEDTLIQHIQLSTEEITPKGCPLYPRNYLPSVQPEEVAGVEISVDPIEKENAGNQTSSELPERDLDEHCEIVELVEVTGGKSGNGREKNLLKTGGPLYIPSNDRNPAATAEESPPVLSEIIVGHLNPPTDGTLVLPDIGRNQSDNADVGNRPNANPPLVKANNKISEICKVLSEGNFSKSELSNVVEVLVYHLGAEPIGNLAIGFAHQYEIVDLCHACFAAMGEEAFSRLEVEQIKFSGLRYSAIEFLNKETSQLLNSRHP